MVTQCRYQALKTLHADIAMAQMVESCDLVVGTMMRGARCAHVIMMDVPGLEEVDASPLTLNVVVNALHTALAPQPSTTAVHSTSVLKCPSMDLGGDRKQIKNLQEGLRNLLVFGREVRAPIHTSTASHIPGGDMCVVLQSAAVSRPLPNMAAELFRAISGDEDVGVSGCGGATHGTL